MARRSRRMISFWHGNAASIRRTRGLDAISFYPIAGAEEINAGKADPRALGVRAEDDLTSSGHSLSRPAAHFLKLSGTGCVYRGANVTSLRPIPRTGYSSHGLSRTEW